MAGTLAKWSRHFRARRSYRRETRIGRSSPNPWIQKSAHVEGWLHAGEHEFLWDLAVRPGAGHILEIGTWCGKSTCILAGACIVRGDGSRVICVDSFRMNGTPRQQAYYRLLRRGRLGTYYDFVENATRFGFSEHVLPLAMSPRQARELLCGLGLSLRLAFLDGQHDYTSLCQDMSFALDHLAPGGVLAVHDLSSQHPGLTQAVEDTLAERHGMVPLGQVHCLAAYRVGRPV